MRSENSYPDEVHEDAEEEANITYSEAEPEITENTDTVAPKGELDIDTENRNPFYADTEDE